MTLNIEKLKLTPKLDPCFLPAAKWNEAYLNLTRKVAGSRELALAIRQTNSVSVYRTEVLPHDAYRELNIEYIERLLKFLLWSRGGSEVYVAGCDFLADELRTIYSPGGRRAFDCEFMGKKIYSNAFKIIACRFDELPVQRENSRALGGHFNGNRIGFDLGGSDRKCVAMANGQVVFSAELPWAPYFQADPVYHLQGIEECVRLAASHLPGGKPDAIGGSAAGVYVDNSVCASSLFRGISTQNFKDHIASIFIELGKRWDVPCQVVNDGDVAALAGAMSTKDNAVLGISMGTSEAGGYVDMQGRLTPWLSELAFAPVDYRRNGPIDEWSGDRGCGVQFFSQQAVARLIPRAGLQMESASPAKKLSIIQELVTKGDNRAIEIFETIGVCFGYTIAHYAKFYQIRNLLVLGRVTSGAGGKIIVSKARAVLKAEYPTLAEKIHIHIPGELDRRRGQAIAAATLPQIGN